MRHFPYGFVSSFSSTIRLSSVFNFRLPSIDSLASMSAPRRSVIISLSFIIAMIATSILQNYKKVIEYGRFSQKLKIIAKILATFRNNIYLCTQNNGRVPFIGIGVSPIGRVVRFVATLFLCLLGWIDFEAQKFAVLHEYIGSQYVIGQIDCLGIQNVASQWVSYQVGNLQTSNVF